MSRQEGTVPHPPSNPADEQPTPRRGRGRRPSDEVRADVLHTVGEILLDEGLADFTIERVARQSGVSKTTIYKWWPSRGALALDGYFHKVETTLAFPDTDDIRADLTTQLHAFGHLVGDTPAGRLLAELIGAAQTDPELATAYRSLYSAERRRLAVTRLLRAQESGQVRPEVDPQVVVDQLWGAVYHRLLIPDEPINPTFITALLDNLLTGIMTPGH
ncbi:TetR/AcrR family transcriptional regulator [Streptomyces triticagri]|uniref:TetR/AcrR family transcriptional regulator n=1 Tax=Streptomyces triticagri TaxID=2293568 RepID=A0A372MCP8_9ACTN|nr:TetR/AcrR family transcriptional regulator [Streptomyces triticagri]RFU88360.1 TetR/AcrR family transcriptional regulator [Streptomyces triticagri]